MSFGTWDAMGYPARSGRLMWGRSPHTNRGGGEGGLDAVEGRMTDRDDSIERGGGQEVNLPHKYEVIVARGKRTLIEHAPSYRPANKGSIPIKHADYRAVASFRPNVWVKTIEEAARLDAKSRNARWSANDREDARLALHDLLTGGSGG